MTPREAAKQWMERGFLPIPVPHKEKAPVVAGWQELRLSQRDLTKYFGAVRQNVGILLGDDSGSADIDLDCSEAVTAAAELAPPTAMIFGRKSKPASHYLYRSSPAVLSRKFTDPTDKSTVAELRGQKASGAIGLQTVVPPSVHPSGEHVRFEPGGDGPPGSVQAPVLATAVANIAAAALLARHWPKDGSRHEAFLALAGMLARADWTVHGATIFHRAIYRILWGAGANMSACDAEVAGTFERHALGGETTGFRSLADLLNKAVLATALKWLNVASYSPTPQPPEWPDIAPFAAHDVTPLTADLFPGFLGDMVAAVAAATETPIELPGLLGLAVAAACVAGKVTVSPEPGYVEPVNIYVAVGMESGNRKTAVLRHMAHPFIDWEHKETRRLMSARKQLISERKTVELRIECLRKKAAALADATGLKAQIAELEAALPDIPALPRLWVQDVTPEQLAVVMADQSEHIALLSDEGGIFDLLAGRYNKGLPNLDLFLQAHSGSSVRIDRGSRPPILMHNPALTVALAPQPDVLQNLSDQPGFRGRGLLARFLYALPASPLGSRLLTANPIPSSVSGSYQRGILGLIALVPALPIDGEAGTWQLKFSSDAYVRWKEFQRVVERHMREGGKLYDLKDWASKLPGAVARIAGIMHCVGTTPGFGKLVIELAVVEQAISLSVALIDHAIAVFNLMQQEPVVEDARRILKWIRRLTKPQFTLRDCFCAHQGHFKTVDAVHPSIQLLEQHGYLQLAPAVKTGGRPSEIYLVNPQALEIVQ